MKRFVSRPLNLRGVSLDKIRIKSILSAFASRQTDFTDERGTPVPVLQVRRSTLPAPEGRTLVGLQHATGSIVCH